jgi:hypothetical protein
MAKEREWRDISVLILDRTLQGITDVEYTPKQDKEYVYGRGSDPTSIQSGRRSVEGSITLLQSELDMFMAAAQKVNPLWSILDVSFDIIVVYADGLLIGRTDTIVGCQIKEYKKSMSSDDKFMKIALPFMGLKIVHT